MKIKNELNIILISLILIGLSGIPALAATTVSTQAVTGINATYATANGTLDDAGGATIVQHGFVWSSVDSNPTLAPPIAQSEWKMNDNAANTTVADSAGSNTGTAAQNTSAITTTGKINSAFNFNGSSDYIYTATQYSNPQIFSISAWFKTSTASGRKIVGFESNQSGTASASYDRQIYMGTDGKVRFGWHDGSVNTIASSSTLNDGNWHHAVATYNSGSASFYIDGNLQGSLFAVATGYTGYWRIGGYKTANWTNGSNGYFTGQIDDVRIFNSAITPDDVALLYNSGSGTESSDTDHPCSKLGPMSGAGSFSFPLGGLLPNTTYYVRSYVTDSDGTTTYGSAVSFTTANSGYATWLGGTSSSWSEGTNWSTSSPPDSNTEVVINGNGSNAPVLDLSGGTVSIKALSIGATSASTLTFSNGDASTKKLAVAADVGIGSFGTISHTASTTVGQPEHKINIEATNLYITDGGQINADYKGYQHSEGPGAGTNNVSGYGSGGASYGGTGGSGGPDGDAGSGAVYGSISQPADLGSGGGDYGGCPNCGGSGGGGIKLTVSEITSLFGNISVRGQNTQGSYSGGGSGGSIWIDTESLSGSGVLNASGGLGASSNDGSGAGGGGRIAVHYTTDASSIQILAYGGYNTGNPNNLGGAGTIYKESTAQSGVGDLIVDNNLSDTWNDRFIGRTPLNDALSFDTITVQNYGNLETGSSSNISYSTLDWSTNGIITDNGGTFLPSNLTIPAGARLVGNTARTLTGLTIGGVLTHTNNRTPTSTIYKLDYSVNGDLTIESGGAINADKKGYRYSSGPGAGSNGTGSGGGGYGGSGGAGLDSSTVTNPGGGVRIREGTERSRKWRGKFQ